MSKQIQTIAHKQSLSMTAAMHQSIRVLQMSCNELALFADEAIQQNPLLEEDTTSSSKLQEQESTTPQDDKIDYGQRDSYTSKLSYSDSGNGANTQDYIANIAEEKTLKDYLTEQIHLIISDSKEKLIAQYLLDNIEPSGYLKIDLQTIAQSLKCDLTIIKKVLRALQTLDPSGIFARDAKECLLIQARDKALSDPVIYKVIDNIELLAKSEITKLAKICGCNKEKLSEAIKQIKALNPKPASGFAIEQVSYKIPDIFLYINSDNSLKLEANYEILPRLQINNDLVVHIKNGEISGSDKEFMQSAYMAATTVCRSIQQRAATILKIASAIANEQVDFFTRGVMYLKPMTLSHIAAITGYNESTVSRSTSNKYIATPLGIFEMKFFFTSKISSKHNHTEEISSTKVKEIIRQIIASEEAGEIYSDDDISVELKKFNINIARRTVAKYREQMAIPTSALRKRKSKIEEL